MAQSPLPLRCFSGYRATRARGFLLIGPAYPRAPGLQLSRSGQEAPVRARAALCEADWAWSPARARFLPRPFGPRGPRGAPLLGGAVTGRAGAEGPARWPPLGPRLRDPLPAAVSAFGSASDWALGRELRCRGGSGIALLGSGRPQDPRSGRRGLGNCQARTRREFYSNQKVATS